MTSRRRFSTSVMLFGLVFAAVSCFHQSRDWNSASRLLLSYGLVQTSDIQTTPFLAVGGRLLENPLTWDLSSPDGRRFYCDKAPGQSFGGAGAFWLLRVIGLADDHPLPTPGKSFDAAKFSYWPTDARVTILTSGAATAGAAVMVFWLVLRWGGTLVGGLAAGLSLALCTPMFAYGTLFYGHALAGFFSLSSLYFCERSASKPEGRFDWHQAMWAFFAGLFAGLAVVVEYTLAVFVVAMAVAGVLRAVDDRRGIVWAVAFLLGGLCAASLLGTYHYAIAGDPWTTPYRFEIRPEFAAVHSKGIGAPSYRFDSNACWELLFGSRRGLFLFAPTLLGGILGLLLLARRRPSQALATALTTVGLTLLIAGMPNWDGGLAAGPRFLTPMMPLLGAACGLWLSQPSGGWFIRLLKAAWIVAAGASAALSVLITTAGARMPTDVSIAQYLRDASDSSDRPVHLIESFIHPIAFQWNRSRPGFEIVSALMFVMLVAMAAALLRYARRSEAATTLNN